MYRQLAGRFPQSPRYPRELARQWANVGRKPQAEEAFESAVAALVEALARGYPPSELAKAVDLAPLAGRPDFQKLLEPK